MKIRNRENLLATGEAAARSVVLDVLEAALSECDIGGLIVRGVSRKGDALHVGKCRYDLSGVANVYVVGAGKACNHMALALEDALGDTITQGICVVKRLGPEGRPRRIALHEGGHPIPNDEGHEATRRILELVSRATPRDLFIGLISGGSSALMSHPVSGVSLGDEREMTRQLLHSGARILEINAVRRHISAVNGGRLAEAVAARGARMINLIVSDGVGAPPTSDPFTPCAFFGTPVAPDATTLADARAVLKKYGLLESAPRAVLDYLCGPDGGRETPKALSERVQHFVLERPADACEAALRAAKAMGLPALVLTTLLQGESREAGTFLACLAKEAAQNRRPLAPPCVLICGGETTTAVTGPCRGSGGPSQELALAFALETGGRGGLAIGALDTDGTDGPTDIAGGLTDGETTARARAAGLDPFEHLRLHDTSPLLAATGDAIVTGNTGTNLCDLNVIFVA